MDNIEQKRKSGYYWVSHNTLGRIISWYSSTKEEFLIFNLDGGEPRCCSECCLGTNIVKVING